MDGPQTQRGYDPREEMAKTTIGGAQLSDRPPSAYESAIQELDMEISQAQELFADLVQRVAPVIRDEPQNDSSAKEASPSYSSRVARDIQDRTARVRQLRQTIRTIRDLVDL